MTTVLVRCMLPLSFLLFPLYHHPINCIQKHNLSNYIYLKMTAVKTKYNIMQKQIYTLRWLVWTKADLHFVVKNNTGTLKSIYTSYTNNIPTKLAHIGRHAMIHLSSISMHNLKTLTAKSMIHKKSQGVHEEFQEFISYQFLMCTRTCVFVCH